MVYEKSIDELTRICDGLYFSLPQNKKCQNENFLLIKDEMDYHVLCYKLQFKNVPEEYFEMQKAESFYKKGEMQKAIKILYELNEEIELLSMMNKKNQN